MPSSDPVANNSLLNGEKSNSVTCFACPEISGKLVNRPQASIGRIASDPIPTSKLKYVNTEHAVKTSRTSKSLLAEQRKPLHTYNMCKFVPIEFACTELKEVSLLAASENECGSIHNFALLLVES